MVYVLLVPRIVKFELDACAQRTHFTNYGWTQMLLWSLLKQGRI